MCYMRRCLPFSRLAVVSFSGGIALTMVPAYKKAVFHAPKYGFPHCVVHFIRALGNFRGARIDFAKRGKNSANSYFLRPAIRELSVERPVLWHAQPRCRSRRLYRVAYTGCTVRQVRMEYFKKSLYYIRPLRPVVRVRYNLKSLDCIFKLNFFDSYIPVAKAQTKWFFRDIGRAGNKIPLGVGSQGESPI